MFGHGFFSTIFKQADIHPKDKKNNDLIKSPDEITNDNLEETAKQDKKISQSDKNENREKRKVSAEISPEDVKKIQAKKTVSKLPVNIVQPSIDRVRTPKDAKIVYLDISKNNKTISKNIKKTLTNLNIGEAKRVSTANDILEQSKRTADSLQYISDNLIDEQNTKVTRTSDYNPEKNVDVNIEKTPTPDKGGMLGFLGPWLGKQLAKFFSMIKNFVSGALKGIWSFMKTSVSKMWSWAKESKIGKMVSNGVTKAKNVVSDVKTSVITKTKSALTSVKDLGKAGLEKVTSKVPMIGKIGEKLKPVVGKTYSVIKNATNFSKSMIEKGIGKVANSAIVQKVIKSVVERKMTSVAASKIPVFGLAVGAFTSAMYAMDGDWKGATAALASAGLGATGAGVPAALAIDIMLLAREAYRLIYGILPDNDPYFSDRFSDIKEKLGNYIKSFFPSNQKAQQAKSTANVNKAKAVLNNASQQKFKKTPSLNNKNTQTNPGIEKPSLFNNFKASMLSVANKVANVAGNAIDDIGNSAPDNLQLAKNLLISTSDVKKALAIASQKSGVPIDILQKIANIESNFKPSASNKASSAKGLFQFTNVTWSRMMKLHRGEYGLIGNESPFDPTAAAFMGAAYIKDNMKQLQGVKSNLTATDMYIAHFMGANGAKNFLKAMAQNPSGNAAAMFPPAAAANKNIFYTSNGRPRTLAAIYKLFQYKMGEKMELPTINGVTQTVPQNVNSTQNTTPAPVNTGSKLTDFFSGFTSGFSNFFNNYTFNKSNNTTGTGGTGGLPNYNMNVASKVAGAWKGQGATPGLTFDRNVQTTGVKPGMLDNLAAMAADYKSRTGKTLRVTSAYRSYAVQQTLYDQAVEKYGASQASKYVAPPGKSVHGYGLGIDVGDKATMDQLESDGTLQNYGFWRPLKNATSKEYWHIEPIGSRDSATNKNLQGDGANGNQTPSVNSTKASNKSSTNASDIKKNNAKSLNSAQGDIDKSQSKPNVSKKHKEQAVSSNSKTLAENSNVSNNTDTTNQVNNNNTIINSANNDNGKDLKSIDLFRF